MAAHTSFKRGTHVFVHLTDGTSFEDHFVEHRARYVVLRGHGRVAISAIRAMSIFRNQVLPVKEPDSS